MWVEEIEQLVGVDFLGRRENDHLVQLRHPLQEFPEPRSRLDVNLRCQC